MNSTDLAFLSALEQAQLIRDRTLSPQELVQVYLDRIDRLNPDLGSYFTVMADQAQQEAIAKTEQLMHTDVADLPAFFGVAIAIKDLNAVQGVPFTCGNPALKNQVAPYDDGVVTRLRQAGFTLLGKTATSELGSMPFTEPHGFPPARNPWHLNHTPGGSSGGSAAAVAAGLTSIAQGSDGGGSIRGPASCCGLVGLKPARGRISMAPLGDCLSGLATSGPLGRTVADVAALLDVMAGYVVGDPYWLPDPPVPFRQITAPSTPQRIAVVNAIAPIGKPHPDCSAAVQHMAQALESLGHHLEPLDLDCAALVEPFQVVWRGGVKATRIPVEALEPVNQWLFNHPDSSGDYQNAVWAMQMAARRLVAQLADYDAILMPALMAPPIALGAWADLPPEALMQQVIQWVSPCPLANATGLPAIALPALHNAAGLPIGVQLVGRPADEATLLALAYQLEASGAWDTRRPAIAL